MAVEKIFLDSSLLPQLVPSERALLRSQGVSWQVSPSLPWPFFFPRLLALAGAAVLSIALAINAQVARVWVERRGYAVESAAARICWGRRVCGIWICGIRTSAVMRSSRKVSLFHGAQLGIDTTLVSPFVLMVWHIVVVPTRAQCKDRIYPEFSGEWSRQVGGSRR